MKFKGLLTLILVLNLTPSCGLAGQLYVVVSNNLRNQNFSAQEIKLILLGEISSINNSRLNLIYPSYSSPEIITLSKFVGKGGSVRNLKSYWSKMIFTGRGTPPLTADNLDELKRLIEQNNSIGVSSMATGMHVVYTISD